jgi:hypothetical protein
MIALEVAVTLLRELLRALLTPLRLLGYLPWRHYWRRVAREVLDAAAHTAPEAAETALRDFFAKPPQLARRTSPSVRLRGRGEWRSACDAPRAVLAALGALHGVRRSSTRAGRRDAASCVE